MKVILPSNGILGLKHVDLRQPKYSDFRKVQSLNQEELLLKAEFVKLLIPESTDLSKMTYYDLDYLYTIAVFSSQFNSITYRHKFACECNEVPTFEFKLDAQEVVDLPKMKLPHVKNISGTDYNFNILSAQQHIDACTYALQQEDFNNAYQDACAAFILGKTLDDIEYIHNLDTVIYLACFLFQRVCFHGLFLEQTVKCPKCGKEETVAIQLDTSFIKFDLNVYMAQYANVSSVVDFDTFLDFTIPEFKAFIESLNNKV